MDGTRYHPILNYLHRVLGTPPEGGVSDADLLRRFVRDRDEAAFELLLWRHAAMVLRVCRHVLRDQSTAEDAFQATFLVFVRKAGSISRRESLGGWLYRVAYHIALKARQRVAKRTSVEHELASVDPPAAPADADDVGRRELREMICEEVNCLPAKYRAPIVACYFEAKTHEEAANQLGWPQGTVASRLARGRDLLRRRLLRRGIALTAAAFTAALAAPAAQAALTGLISSTLQTAKLFAARAPVAVRGAALAEGVLQAMYWTRIKIGTVVLLLAGLLGAGAAFWSTQKSAAEPPGVEIAAASQAAADSAQTTVRNMALSRLNLRKLALALHHYADTHKGLLPPPAVIGKDGKALLSWRVLLLPYLGELELYQQFKLSEPWDSPHNKKLLAKMPAVYAPPGIKTREPYSTFYQAFISPKPKGGGAGFGGAGGGGAGAAGVGAPVESVVRAAFTEGQQGIFPGSFPDGLANTILFVEAGKAVPWTKPEDLPYAADQPLPKLGGLFPDIFHAVYASGETHTLTKQYDEFNLRAVITSNGGEVMDFEKIEARPAAVIWRRKNQDLQQDLEDARQRLRRLREEWDALHGKPSSEKTPPESHARLEELKKENARLQKELEKVKKEMRDLDNQIHRDLQKATNKKPS